MCISYIQLHVGVEVLEYLLAKHSYTHRHSIISIILCLWLHVKIEVPEYE